MVSRGRGPFLVEYNAQNTTESRLSLAVDFHRAESWVPVHIYRPNVDATKPATKPYRPIHRPSYGKTKTDAVPSRVPKPCFGRFSPKAP